MQSQMTFESMMQHIMTIRDRAYQEGLPLPKLRANSETIGIIGHMIKARTDHVNYPYTLSVPATIWGMTVEIDESVPNEEIRPIYTEPLPYSGSRAVYQSERKTPALQV